MKSLFRPRYEILTDDDGVQWRKDVRNPDALVVKAYDPNFVHAKVPLPGQVTILGIDTDALALTAFGIGAVSVFLIGTLIGSAI